MVPNLLGMERRRLGRTEHYSSVAILGCCAFGDGDVEAARETLELAIGAGVNHIDIAPSYGDAERAIGASLSEHRSALFVGCKTTERQAGPARGEMEQSLERLHIDAFDLYQFHGVTDEEELDALCAPGGAAEAVFRAKDEGLCRFVGITGHFLAAPRTFLRALDRLDLDTVMFPVNAGHLARPDYRRDAEALFQRCAERDVGVMAIKALARRPWQGERRYRTWYEPLDEPGRVQAAVDFALSQPIAAFATPCDRRLVPLALDAAEHYRRLDEAALEAALAQPDLEALAGPILPYPEER
jgi:aryl-alcohol dehydrogenase-like predicted oxidoreductase